MRLISGRFREQRHKVTGPLSRGVFVVPATITSLGLLAGFYSLISSIDAHFELAAVMIAVAFICDGLDGRVARVSRTTLNGRSFLNLEGFAPAGEWEELSVATVGSGEKHETSDDL